MEMKKEFLNAPKEERQDLVNGAQFLLEIDACRQYGLIKTDMVINQDKCLEMLALGKEYGVLPQEQLRKC